MNLMCFSNDGVEISNFLNLINCPSVINVTHYLITESYKQRDPRGWKLLCWFCVKCRCELKRFSTEFSIKAGFSRGLKWSNFVGMLYVKLIPLSSNIQTTTIAKWLIKNILKLRFPSIKLNPVLTQSSYEYIKINYFQA